MTFSKKDLAKWRSGLYAGNPQNCQELVKQLDEQQAKLKQLELSVNWAQLKIIDWADFCRLFSPLSITKGKR